MPLSRPTNYSVPFANAGTKNTIPTAATGTGKASFTEGFPAVTMLPLTAGGIPPEGKDFNGILYDVTTHTVWVNAGGQYQFDAALSTAIGGYPKGMVLQSNDGRASYVSAVDNNTTDFNSTPSSIGTLWLPYAGRASAASAITTTGGATVLTDVQYGSDFITVSGVLTSNASIIFPAKLGKWTVINNTTGAYTVTCYASGGGGVPVVQGKADSIICDGTDVRYALTDGVTQAAGDSSKALATTEFAQTASQVADTSLRKTTAGLQANDPVSYVGGGTTALAAADHGKAFVLTGNQTFTAPLTTSLWNGAYVTVVARNGVATFTPNAADKVNNGTVGASYTLAQGISAVFICDGAGNWQPVSVTIGPGGYYPRRIAATTTVSAGTYLGDTSGGAFTINLPAGPVIGDSCEFIDPFGTWGTYNLIIGRNGKNIMGLAQDLVCNVAGRVFKLIYNGTEWRLE